MRTAGYLFALLVFLAGTTPAVADIRVAQVPVRYLVIPVGQGGEKIVSEGQVAFSFPLRWENAALLDSTLEIIADDRRTMIRPGQALVETRLIFDQPNFLAGRSPIARLGRPTRRASRAV